MALLLFGNIPVDDGKDIIGPTIFGKVTPKMSIVHDEIFGPVLVIQTYTTLEERDLPCQRYQLWSGCSYLWCPKKAHSCIKTSKKLVKSTSIVASVTCSAIWWLQRKVALVGKVALWAQKKEFLEVKAVFID